MKKFAYLLFIPFAFSALIGCGGGGYEEIELSDSIPSAYVDEEYDFSYCFIAKEGFDYNIEAYSYHGATKSENQLEVDGLCFTPKSADPISVVLHATKGSTKLQKTVGIDVKEKGDSIEELLINTGASGYADAGFQKSLDKLAEHKRPGGTSKTSIVVSYSGNHNYWAGGAVFCPNNFRCLEHWKDKEWKNAILRFWVYNDSDYSIEFGLRIKDNFTKDVDIDMTQEGNPSKFAEPHKWTEILFPLRPLGVTHTLYQNEEGTRNDSFTIKAKWQGIEYNDPSDPFPDPIMPYKYNFYVDDLDVVPNTDYPDVPTYLPDTLDRLVNGTWCEDCFKRELNYDTQFIKDGESSIKVDCDGDTVTWGNQVICLNSPNLIAKWSDQNWNNAIMNFWVYNPTEHDIKIQLLLKDSKRNFVIDWGTEYATEEVAVKGTWTQVFFSMNRLRVNRPLVKNDTTKDEFNVKILWDGPNKTPYTFYIDKVDVEPNTKYPQVNTDPVVPTRIETIEDGWENMEQDTGWESATIATEINEVCTKTYDSATSKKLVINPIPSDKPYNQDFAISPEGEFKTTGNLPDIRDKKLDFDLKFDNTINNRETRIKVVQKTWSFQPEFSASPTDEGDGWYHVSFDFSKETEAATLTEVIRFGFYFTGVDATLRQSHPVVYIDNIFLTEAE